MRFTSSTPGKHHLADVPKQVVNSIFTFIVNDPAPDITVHIFAFRPFECHKEILLQPPKYATILEKYPQTTILYCGETNCDLPIISFLYAERLDPKLCPGQWISTLIGLIQLKSNLPPGLYEAARAASMEYHIDDEGQKYNITEFIHKVYHENGALDEDLREAIIFPYFDESVQRLWKAGRPTISLPSLLAAFFLSDGVRWNNQ
jgi:hypothetical protein